MYRGDEESSHPGGKMADMDWIGLWKDLVNEYLTGAAQAENTLLERWGKRRKQAGYSEERRRKDRDDPLMRFVLSQLGPDDTVIDIGAGIGRWSIPMSKTASLVTALDALSGMLEFLVENARDEDALNIKTVEGDWATINLQPHDHTLSSHAVYTSPDIVEYALKMEKLSRKTCFMVMRVPVHDGVIGELSARIHGTWYDSPNFVVGYNALLQAGVCGHVIMEDSVRHWHNTNLDDALVRAKQHLRVQDDRHDSVILQTLKSRLVLRDEEYWWPDGMHSALVWWRPRTRR